ncbi:MAG TPA: adenylate/guanylate cyclase domain-containing protein [Kiloniellales bacterium]|nr:adenylate/guanylate cyclase domain-containing protein [Kiloniellales bacterium]
MRKAGPELSGSVMHRFEASAAELWPFAGDTQRFNEAYGVPKHRIVETPRADGSVEFRGFARIGVVNLEWLDHPVNWVAEQWLEHRRDFVRGPLAFLNATLRLVPRTDGGTDGVYQVDLAARTLFGRLIAGKVLKAGLANFLKAAASAERYLAGRQTLIFDYKAPQPDEATRARVSQQIERIEASGHGHGLAARLVDDIFTRQEVDLVRIRPLALAKRWGVAARQAIELCLEATRAGLLTLRWSLLCPRCRVAKAEVASLDALPRGAHCPTCNIDYDRDFAKNVELAFAPAPAVRPVIAGEYCLFGPLSMPHVKLHVTLQPGERRTLAGRLASGPYRFRTLEPGLQEDVEVGDAVPAFTLKEQSIALGAPAPPGQFVLANETERPRTLVIEERRWVEDALTAERVSTLQAFRDLFSQEVLRPGDEVAIEHVTLMFTDLRASTALYGRIGDASAYGLVRDHFAFLAAIVRRHDGAIVKTIGDAIMAAFHRPQDALAAALAIQREVAAFNQAHPTTPVAIKLGLHGGPCIAVTLNDRLDYFGSTANMAARLQAESEGGDIVLAADFAKDPRLEELLAGLPTERAEAVLKGFDQPVGFLRLRPATA